MWRVARRTGGREGDAQRQRPAGTSATQRHHGRPASKLRQLPESVRVAAGRLGCRQDETRQIPTEKLQKLHRK